MYFFFFRFVFMFVSLFGNLLKNSHFGDILYDFHQEVCRPFSRACYFTFTSFLNSHYFFQYIHLFGFIYNRNVLSLLQYTLDFTYTI